MTNEEFLQQYREKRKREDEHVKEAARLHLGKCTVHYYVFGTHHYRTFNTFDQAAKWILARENAGAQSTEKVVLDDGSELEASTSVWHYAESLDS